MRFLPRHAIFLLQRLFWYLFLSVRNWCIVSFYISEVSDIFVLVRRKIWRLQHKLFFLVLQKKLNIIFVCIVWLPPALSDWFLISLLRYVSVRSSTLEVQISCINLFWFILLQKRVFVLIFLGNSDSYFCRIRLFFLLRILKGIFSFLFVKFSKCLSASFLSLLHM